MNTKERILHEALRLFSTRGYEAVGVEDIATAVGIKPASLYKHYRNKQAIFDAIFTETSKRYGTFTDDISFHPDNQDEIDNITADILVKKVKELVRYSLHDEYVSNFRKLMTVEQFRSEELSKLYTQRYVDLMFNYHKELFKKLIDKGLIVDEDPSLLSMMYGSPIYIEIGRCDRHPEMEEECLKTLEGHVRLFYKIFSKNKG